jgi:hypothetical protein
VTFGFVIGGIEEVAGVSTSAQKALVALSAQVRPFCLMLLLNGLTSGSKL